MGLALPRYSAADTQTNLRLGVGHTKSKQTAYYAMTFDRYWTKHGFYRLEMGAWTPNQAGQQSAFLGGFGIGVTEGNLDTFHMQVYLGVVALSRGDNLLSAPFNFTQEFGVGYDQFGFGIKHISNAGLYQPNIGRDFIYFNYRLDF